MATKKTKLFNPKPMQNIGSKVLQFGISGAATTGSAYLANKVIGTKINPKVIGPVAMGLGLAAEIFVEEPHLKAVGRGIGNYGFLHTTGNLILPNSKTDFGLAGIGENANPSNKERIDWEALANQAAEEIEAAKDQQNAGTPVAGIDEVVLNLAGTEEVIENLS